MVPLRRWSRVAFVLGGWLLAAPVAASAQETERPEAEPTAAEAAEEVPALLQQAAAKLRRGELSAAMARYEEALEILAEEPGLPLAATLRLAAQTGVWQIELMRGRYEVVRQGILEAAADLRGQREVVCLLATVQRRLGDHAAAMQTLRDWLAGHAADLRVRCDLADVLAADGRRQQARELWQQNAAAAPTAAEAIAYRARSLFRLGGRRNLEAAAQACVESLAQDPEQRVARLTFGLLKFASYAETDGFASGEKDLKRVLEAHGDDEETLLALYRIRSANMVLDGGKTERLLERVLERNQRCVEAIVLRAANVLDDRRYRDAARMLDQALAIDANDRQALCHRAAVAWLLHDAPGYEAFRARALAGDPGWPDCDRVLADHLVALYRFADALPFFAAALQQAPDDVPSMLDMAKAMIYTGVGARAKELLERSKAVAGGTVDAWRNNALAAQQLLDADYDTATIDGFVVQMHRGDIDVLRAYLLPIQLEAAEVLGRKYGYRPEVPTKVEVFQTWDDFSVRTIGFRGFTALGACFGRLITLVSPVDGDLRQQDFMWEATAWHEYTHVLTLGLSQHRVPRWLTEGFSVYEERARDPSWERGMDRELFDAVANQDIAPVHLLNRLFRGPRILFGYYQGGLIVEWITQHHGFAKALELLKAFAEDLDTEEAFERALGIPSRSFDRQFLAWVQAEKLRGMRLVARLDDAAIDRAALRAAQDRSAVQPRLDLAWAFVQRDNPVDAGRWLGEVLRIDPEHAQAKLVRAELLRRREDFDGAVQAWQAGFALGADDFDSRIQCGRVLLERGDVEGAMDMWQRAKACWPGCTEQDTAPELLLARLYRDRGDATAAQMEMKAYCKRSARAFTPRYTLAQFERDSGNRSGELRYLIECNRIDPFHRELHVRMGEAQEALGKPAAAAVEFEVAAAVTPQQDRRYSRRGAEPPDAAADLQQRAELWLRAARARRVAGDTEQALNLLDRIVREAAATDVAETAKGLQQEWRGK